VRAPKLTPNTPPSLAWCRRYDTLGASLDAETDATHEHWERVVRATNLKREQVGPGAGAFDGQEDIRWAPVHHSCLPRGVLPPKAGDSYLTCLSPLLH
jgi:hypothetical protein